MVVSDDRIIMTGFVQGDELEELFSNCYLYCLPSDVEGMPLSLLEAMSYGRNCLISDIPENTDICEAYTTIFLKGNVNSLKEKLEACLNDKIKYKPDDISNFICNKYDWNNIVDRIMEIYKKTKTYYN